MPITSVKGYLLPMFPLDVHRLINGNKDTINLKRTVADYDDGTPVSLITGTRETQVIEYSVYVDTGEKLNLERFFTREYYYNVRQGNVFIDPTTPTLPSNITELKSKNGNIVRMGLSQGTNMFQMFDIRDGVFKKYKLYSDPEFTWELGKYKCTFQLVELGLSDGTLTVTIENAVTDLPSDLYYVNGGSYATGNQVTVNYDDTVFQTFTGSPGTTTVMVLKPSAYYSLDFRGVHYKLPTLELENDNISVSYEGIGSNARRTIITDYHGNPISDGAWYGEFSEDLLDFSDANYADFGYYVITAPYTIGSHRYNITNVHSTNDSGTDTIVLPTVDISITDALGNNRRDEVVVSVNGFGVVNNTVPANGATLVCGSYNLPSKSVTIGQGQVQAVSWVIPCVTVTFASTEADMEIEEAQVTIDTTTEIVASPYSAPLAVGSHTVSLPQYNMSKGNTLNEGDLWNCAFQVPVLKVVYSGYDGTEAGVPLPPTTIVIGGETHDNVSSPYREIKGYGVFSVTLPEYNVTKTANINTPATAVVKFSIPRITVSWANAYGEDVATSLQLNGTVVAEESPWVGYNPIGANTIELEEYNISYSFNSNEGTQLSRALVIPACDITVEEPYNGESAIGTMLYEDVNDVLDVTYSEKNYHANKVMGSTHTYSVMVNTDNGMKASLTEQHTYNDTAADRAYTRVFQPPMVTFYKVKDEVFEFANQDGTKIVLEMGNADGTKTILSNYSYVPLTGSSYSVNVNGVEWYHSDYSEPMGELTVYVAPTTPGNNITLSVDGSVDVFTIAEGEHKTIKMIVP